MNLFGEPAGLLYRAGFLSEEEQRDLLAEVQRLEYRTFEMHGVAAKRRVLHYGWSYAYGSRQLSEGDPIPEFLSGVQQRAAEWIGEPAAALGEALITEYAPGAGIGWHRDAPQFGTIVGVSLLSLSRMRFRRGETGAWQTTAVELEPRSAYVLSGEARSQWQHMIPPVEALRYSITFRTLRHERRVS